MSAEALAELEKADAQPVDHAAALGSLRTNKSKSMMDALGEGGKAQSNEKAQKQAPKKPAPGGKAAVSSKVADEDDGPAEHNPFKNDKGGSPFQNKKDK